MADSVQFIQFILIHLVLNSCQNKSAVYIRNAVRCGTFTEAVTRLFKNGWLIYSFLYFIYRTIILLVVLYGCETWSLALREEHRLRVFENRVLRRIFGPRRDGVTGEWRKLNNEKLNDLYSSLNIVRVIKSRRMRWAGHVARMEEGRGVHKVVFGKPEGKRPLGRPRLPSAMRC